MFLWVKKKKSTVLVFWVVRYNKINNVTASRSFTTRLVSKVNSLWWK